MSKRYQVARGPVSLPASLYANPRTLKTGETFRSGSNSWIVRQLARGRITEADTAAVKPKPTEVPHA